MRLGVRSIRRPEPLPERCPVEPSRGGCTDERANANLDMQRGVLTQELRSALWLLQEEHMTDVLVDL